MLDGLPETRERQQLELDIHVTLTQALMAGKGYANRETVAALERANRLVTETGAVGTPLHFFVLCGLLDVVEAIIGPDILVFHTTVVCRETTTELLHVLAYPKFELTPTERDLLLAEYLPFAEAAQLPKPLPTLPVACRDRDDVVCIRLAMAAKVDCLVSGDCDLGVLRDVAPVPIISADELRHRLTL